MEAIEKKEVERQDLQLMAKMVGSNLMRTKKMWLNEDGSSPIIKESSVESSDKNKKENVKSRSSASVPPTSTSLRPSSSTQSLSASKPQDTTKEKGEPIPRPQL